MVFTTAKIITPITIIEVIITVYMLSSKFDLFTSYWPPDHSFFMGRDTASSAVSQNMLTGKIEIKMAIRKMPVHKNLNFFQEIFCINSCLSNNRIIIGHLYAKINYIINYINLHKIVN